jgi:hypothetical protein
LVGRCSKLVESFRRKSIAKDRVLEITLAPAAVSMWKDANCRRPSTAGFLSVPF